MKKTYTEEEYRSLAEVAGGEPKPHSKHPISREEYERRKKAKAEGREQSGRALMITSIVSAVILVLCLAVTGISVAIKKSKAKKEENVKTETVLTVDGVSVGADLFNLFCINVIEGPDFEYLMKTSINDDALCSSVKEKAVQYAEEYVCLYREAVKAGLSLSENEIDTIKKSCTENAENAKLSVEEYYRKNYGVSFETYVEVQGNWLLAEKYAVNLRSKCDVSEEALQEVYNAHYEKFAKADVTMVYFDTSSSDEGKNGFVKSNAESIFNGIKVEATGGLYAADDAKLSLAITEQKDTNSFYETGDNADGKATVVGEDAVKYPSLYQAVITMAPGEVRLIHDETASFIVRCDKQYFFEACKDSEELIAYAQELYFKEQFNAARYSGTYTAEKSASYRSIDIKSFVAEGKKHYGR
ncbi:MAG: hypothetical protein J6A50_03520 [Clostridia bacterium]|nr:hypothetical protein [Clostridia bacterium]